MVGSIARRLEDSPKETKEEFEEIEAIVRNGTLAVEHGNMMRLGQLMDANQVVLARWRLSTDKIDRMKDAAITAGALGAKVTGGGGGGCMIALVDSDETHALVSAVLGTFGHVYDV